MATKAPKPTTQARHAALGLRDDDALQMYYLMALARALDERMWVVQRAGKAPFIISGQGHEGSQIGTMWPADRDKDWLVPFYRNVAACLVKGMTPTELMLSVFARAPDPSSGGRQMPAHYAHPARKILSTSSPVGTQIPHAAGIAYAAKIRKTGEVAITYIGEGSTSQGEWHEGMNFAGIHKLPMICVVENNNYAISVPLSKQMGVRSVAVRAAGYGIEGVSLDGTDVLEVYEAAKAAWERARRGEGATLIETRVHRITGHSSEDRQEKYRSPEEIAESKRQDPVVKFRAYLESVGLLDEAGEQEIRARIRREVDRATDEAERAPEPDAASAMRHVYAEE